MAPKVNINNVAAKQIYIEAAKACTLGLSAAFAWHYTITKPELNKVEEFYARFNAKPYAMDTTDLVFRED